MTTDWRALAAELAAELERCRPLAEVPDCLARARAALAAKPVTDEAMPPRVGHILRLAEIIREVDGNHDKGAAALAEAILSHPGIRSAGLAVAPPAEGESASVVGEPSDDELLELSQFHCVSYTLSNGSVVSPFVEGTDMRSEVLSFARAALARWGHQPAPPAEVEQRHPTPVPVSERLPGPEDYDAKGRCWLFSKVEKEWRLIDAGNPGVPHLKYCFSHWLPTTALPLPQGEVEP